MAEKAIAEFNNAEVVEFFKNIDKRLKDVKDGKKKFIGLLSAIVYGDVIRHFEDEKGSDGPWKKWSASYTNKMKENNKAGNKILQDTGRLRNSFKPSNARKVSAGIVWFNPGKTKTGFPYAFAHDTGGPVLPKRDFMWLSDEATDKIAEQTLQFMIEEGI